MNVPSKVLFTTSTALYLLSSPVLALRGDDVTEYCNHSTPPSSTVVAAVPTAGPPPVAPEDASPPSYTTAAAAAALQHNSPALRADEVDVISTSGSSEKREKHSAHKSGAVPTVSATRVTLPFAFTGPSLQRLSQIRYPVPPVKGANSLETHNDELNEFLTARQRLRPVSHKAPSAEEEHATIGTSAFYEHPFYNDDTAFYRPGKKAINEVTRVVLGIDSCRDIRRYRGFKWGVSPAVARDIWSTAVVDNSIITINDRHYSYRPKTTPLLPLPDLFRTTGTWHSGPWLNWSHMREGYAQHLYQLARQLPKELVNCAISYLTAKDTVFQVFQFPSPDLLSLNLSHNHLADAELFQDLRHYFRPNTRWIAGKPVYTSLPLETLILNQTGLPHSQASVCLRDLLYLRRLSLAHNNMSEIPTLPSPALEYVDLSHNAFTDEGVGNFSSRVTTNKLRALLMDHNPYSDRGVYALLSSLREKAEPNLATLSLAGGLLTDEGRAALTNLLPSTITILGLSGVSEEMAKDLGRDISKQRLLQGIPTPITVVRLSFRPSIDLLHPLSLPPSLCLDRRDRLVEVH